jgi:hypothetical protein
MRHDRSARVPAPRRLFTALFADAPARAAIDAARQGWSGLPARLRPLPERMHVTLQFFSAVDAGRSGPGAPRWRSCALRRSTLR